MMMTKNKFGIRSLRFLVSASTIMSCAMFALAAPERPEASSDQSAANAGILLGIIALLLGIAAVCLAVFILLRQNKIQTTVAKLNSKIKKIESMQSDNASTSKQDIEIDRIKRQLDTLADRISRFPVASGNAGQPINQQKPVYAAQNKVTSSDVSSYSQPASASSCSKKVYVSVLSGNSFLNSTSVYTPGKTLYEIDTTDGVTGTIKFVDRKESVAIARRNLTQFIESVCLVQGAVPSNIDGVRTIRPGKVSAVGSAWRLDEKALVEYK